MLANEPQNSFTSKRVLLPLEPDFSQISDPSIVIAPPSNTWVSDNRHTSPRRSRRDLPKDKHKSKKRRRHRSSSSSSSSRSSSTSHKRSKRSKRSKHSHKKEDGVRRRLLLPQIIPFMIIEDIKEQEYLRSLQKFQVLCNLLGLWIRHRLYIRIMRCNKQRTQVLGNQLGNLVL